MCTGSEMGPHPTDGSLRFRNTQPSPWLGTGSSCQPSLISDLRKDPTLGLWVPPVEFGCFYARQDSGLITQGTSFSSWFLNTFEIPAAGLPPSTCSNQQFGIVSVFQINATVPQNTGLVWVLSAGNTAPPSMPPPSNYVEHGRFKGPSDSADPAGTNFTMARTDTLQRWMLQTPGLGQNLYQWQAITAFENGTGLGTPVINRLVIETLVYAFDFASGFNSAPV